MLEIAEGSIVANFSISLIFPSRGDTHGLETHRLGSQEGRGKEIVLTTVCGHLRVFGYYRLGLSKDLGCYLSRLGQCPGVPLGSQVI